MQPNCACDRHNAVVLGAGATTVEGLACLRGSVTVCRNCRRFLSGVPGSEYLNCHGHIEVNSLGKAVFVRTVSDSQREQMLNVELRHMALAAS